MAPPIEFLHAFEYRTPFFCNLNTAAVLPVTVHDNLFARATVARRPDPLKLSSINHRRGIITIIIIINTSYDAEK